MMEQMEQFIIYSTLVFSGLVFGSFAGATVWRLRARQLKEDIADGEEVDKKEYAHLKGLAETKIHNDRSRCLHCHHVLAWYDLLPLVSWLQLRGKCRYCKKPIGSFEPLMEIGTVLFFVGSYVFWPYELTTPVLMTQFALWLIAGVALVILFAYDAKWFLLPNKVVFPFIGVALISALLHVWDANNVSEALINVLGACIALGGIYFALYSVSGGAWVGFGDVKLGLGLGLLLADWKLAVLALFLANLIGCLIVLPALLNKKVTRQSHVPFGPMLIAGWLVAGLFGHIMVDWYLSAMFII